MALAPTDAGLSMRLPSDNTALRPSTPIQGLPSDLPDLSPGQVFSARIQEVLPQNTYRALVAGKSVTLALPEGAKNGDVLELVVVDRGPTSILARTLSPDGADTGAYQHTTLSPAARMIGQLLSETPESTTAPLNKGQPLLNAPPTTAAPLAAALKNAVENSGLFYESHQAQWVAGKRPVDSLLQEPQGQKSDMDAVARSSARQAQNAIDDSVNTAGDSNASKMLSSLNASDDTKAATSNTTQQPATTRADSQQATLPADLRPLVHQQLEAAASQRLIWHGEAWPGQPMDWQIEEDRQHVPRTADEPKPWSTTLRLTTPRLGSVEAKLRLVGNGLQLHLSTAVGASAADMRDELPALSDALSAAGIQLQSAQVRHESEQHESE